MRPICLKVSGLHSFREEQEIRFEELCRGGVFGIFGPTGSGKSSILDAITLALYGKVERASNNTMGIMNQNENQLTVSFIFELGNAAGVKRYRVERSYKRADDVRLRNAASRLVEILDDAEMVLASKDRDVTKQVEKILGLTVEDFTRAVVLPQGKFAEFLSLQGSERRQMLQRLFNLEQYGDRLNERLKGRLEQTRNALAAVEAEQQGLGNASLEALNLARERLAEARREAEEKRNRLGEIESSFAEQKQIWEWQKEKKEQEIKLNRLHGQKAEMEALAERLHRAEQAEFLRPYLEELQGAEQNLLHCGKQAERTEKDYERAKAGYDEKKKSYEEARANTSSQEPKLLIQLESYKQAKALKDEILRKQKELEQQKGLFQQIGKAHAQKQEDLVKLQQLLEKARQKQALIKEELQRKSMKPEFRHKVNQAVQLKQAIDRILEEKKKVEEEIAIKAGQLKELETQQRLNREAERQLQETASALMVELVQHYNLACETERGLDRLSGRIQQTLKEQKQLLEKEREQYLAGQLVKELQEGLPCPVCGSTTHPHPANPREDADFTEWEDQLNQLEELLKDANDLARQYGQRRYQLEQIAKALHEAVPLSGEASKEAAVGVIGIVPPGEEGGTELLVSHLPVQERIAAFQQEVARADEVAKDLARNIARFEEESRKRAKEIALVQQRQNELLVRAENMSGQLGELQEKVAALQSEWLQQTENWQKGFAEFDPDTILQTEEEIRNREKEIEDLNQRLEKSILFIEEKENERNALQQELNRLAVTLARVETELGNLRKQIESDRQRLRELTRDEEVESLIERVTRQLQKLKEGEERAKQELEISEQLLRTCEKEFTAAKEALAIARNRLASARQKWEAALQSTGFQSLEEVQGSLIPKEVQREWKERIERFRDEVKTVENELAKLMALLAGRSLTEAEWEQAQLELQSARKALEEALDRKSRAEKEVEDLEQKHARWNDLEKRRVSHQELLNRLQKLQGVLRGNAFVEFIAEEQLMQISRDASARLGKLTRGRYAIEVDSQGGFVIRDDYNGGLRRPVSTLSGGETFLTSLALALSLSAQIQLRGEYPLEFFFLDEGFGTLDPELLDTVITALERLHANRLSVGVISHVIELRERIIRKLIVEPAEPSGRGSRVRLEGV